MSTKQEETLKMIPELEDIRHVAYWTTHRGWAEGGSGNLSVRLDNPPEGIPTLKKMGIQMLPFEAPELGEEYILITATGSRMRDMIHSVEEHLCLIKINTNGEKFAYYPENLGVTSEFATHIAVHSILKKERPEFRAVLHTQPTRLVALTHFPDLQDKVRLVDALFRMHPETRVILPEKIKVLPYAVPGSPELGRITARALRAHRLVVWEKHGVISVGKDLKEALDYVELVEKAAELYWTAVTAGIEPTGLSEEQIAATLRAFRLM